MNRPFGWLLDHRMTPRVVMGALVLAFAAQLEVINLYGEPYPALVMPEFRGGGMALRFPQQLPLPAFVVHFADGSKETLTMRALLDGVTDGQHWHIIWSNFGLDRLSAPAATAGPADGWLPGWSLTQQRRKDPARAAAAVPWLRTRLEQVFPGRQPMAVVVRWSVITVGVNAVSEPTLFREARLSLAR
jgi:hypothetical protein